MSSLTTLLLLLTSLTTLKLTSAQSDLAPKCLEFDRLSNYLWQYHQAYRVKNGTSEATWAGVLGDTAFYHAQDAAVNPTNGCTIKTVTGWSNVVPTGVNWTACCNNDTNNDCTFNKPKEINTTFTDIGSELIYVNADETIDLLEEIETIYDTVLTDSQDKINFLLSKGDYDGYNEQGVAVYNHGGVGVISIWTGRVAHAPCAPGYQVYKPPFCNQKGETIDVQSVIGMALVNVERALVGKPSYNRSHQLTAASSLHATDLNAYRQASQPLSAWSSNFPDGQENFRWVPCSDDATCNNLTGDQPFYITGFFETAYELVSDLTNKTTYAIKDIQSAVESILANQATRDLILNTGAWQDVGDFYNMGASWDKRYMSLYFSNEGDSAPTCPTPTMTGTVPCPYTGIVNATATTLETEALKQLNAKRSSSGNDTDAKSALVSNDKLRSVGTVHITDLEIAKPSANCGPESWSANYAGIVAEEIGWVECPCYGTITNTTDKERCKTAQAVSVSAYGGRSREMIIEHTADIRTTADVTAAVTALLNKGDNNDYLLQTGTYAGYKLLNAGVSIRGKYLVVHCGELDLLGDSSDPSNNIACVPTASTTTTSTSTTTAGSGDLECYNETRTVSALDVYAMKKVNDLRSSSGGTGNKVALTWSAGLRAASYFHTRDLQAGGVDPATCGSLSWSSKVNSAVSVRGKTWNACPCYNTANTTSRDNDCTWQQPKLISGWSSNAQISECAITYTSAITSNSQLDAIFKTIEANSTYNDALLGTGRYVGHAFTIGSCTVFDRYLSCFLSAGSEASEWNTTCGLTYPNGAVKMGRVAPIALGVVMSLFSLT